MTNLKQLTDEDLYALWRNLRTVSEQARKEPDWALCRSTEAEMVRFETEMQRRYGVIGEFSKALAKARDGRK
jgi:hypothetical protein